MADTLYFLAVYPFVGGRDMDGIALISFICYFRGDV